jgi:FkbM family methyltransferase
MNKNSIKKYCVTRIKLIVIKFLYKFNFLDSTFRYSKGIGFQGSLKSEIDYLINKNETQFILFDIGANVGDYSLLVVNLFPNSTVWSFEPSKPTYDLLVENTKRYSQINPIQTAFGEHTKLATLYSDQVSSGMASLFNRDLNFVGIKFNYTEEVKVIRLDDWVADNGIYPDYIKIDVEGSELSVLKGAINTLNHIKAVQFEFGGTAIDAKTYFKDYYNFFTQLNFNLYRYTPMGLLKIETYSEKDEVFEYMNYLAVPTK